MIPDHSISSYIFFKILLACQKELLLLLCLLFSYAFLPDVFGCTAIWPAAFWAGAFWAGAFLPAVVIFAGTFAATTAAAPLATGILGRSFQECYLLKLTSSLIILFLIFFAFVTVTIRICHPGFNLLSPSCGCPFCTDICLLPGLSGTLLGRHCVGT